MIVSLRVNLYFVDSGASQPTPNHVPVDTPTKSLTTPTPYVSPLGVILQPSQPSSSGPQLFTTSGSLKGFIDLC